MPTAVSSDTFLNIYIYVFPYIDYMLQEHANDTNNQIYYNKLANFIYDHYFLRVEKAISSGNIWTYNGQIRAVRSKDAGLTFLRIKFNSTMRDRITKSIISDFKKSSKGFEHALRYLKARDLLFKTHPLVNDYARIELSYMRSRAYVKHLISRANKLNEYVTKYGFEISSKELLDIFVDQQSFTDSDALLTEEIFTVVNALLMTKIDHQNLASSEDFKIIHSKECEWQDLELPTHTQWEDNSLTIFTCDHWNSTATVENYPMIEYLPELRIIQPRLLDNQVSSETGPLRRINFTRYLTLPVLTPQDQATRYKTIHLVMHEKCHARIKLRNGHPPVESFNMDYHQSDPSEIWYGIHKALVKFLTSLKFAQTYTEWTRLNTLKTLFDGYFKIYEQGIKFGNDQQTKL